tara:strand:- start:14671 stop:15828 length:1158 start_codon:yes stop_codon:yes gene_type:complete
MSIQHLEVIFKLTSRCNINCTYCYYFYGADQDWKSRPKKISAESVQDTIDFLKQAIEEHNIKSLQIDFHGGEPLLYGKKAFEAVCILFKQQLGQSVKLHFAIQTNAMLIDDEWVDIFEKYNIGIAISLDGPKLINDKLRIDHKGKGTYTRVVEGLKQLQTAERASRISPVSNLAVINPNTSGKAIYRHFVDDLNLYNMDFLLPGDDYDTYDPEQVHLYGDFLIDVLNEWIKDNNPKIKIRLFSAFIAKLYGQTSFMFPTENFDTKKNIAMTIDSDGMVYGDDALRSNQAWNQYKAIHIKENTFTDFQQVEKQWHEKNVAIPKACAGCIWEQTCAGGHLENRYSSQSGYQNPTIYCEALQRVYQQIIHFLIDSGMPLEKLTQNIAA